tara:strand:- start:960 stop:1550 length:591 start_codon:yes stop_codon:yes gene_type:complete
MTYSGRHEDINRKMQYYELGAFLVGRGFEKVHEHSLPENDVFCLWANYSMGLVAAADSFDEGINGAILHFQVTLPAPHSKLEPKASADYSEVIAMSDGGGPIDYHKDHTKRSIKHDIGRKGLNNIIEFIDNSELMFNCPWNTPFVDILHLADHRLKRYLNIDICDMETSSKLEHVLRSTLPEKFKEMIAFQQANSD